MKKHSRRSVPGIVFFVFILAAIVLYVRGSSGSAKIEFVEDGATATQTATPNEIDSKIKEFGIKIEKINVLVPVIKDVDGKNKTAYNKALKDGVAHFSGTALPGEKGNIFVFGHSSADYKTDFAKVFVDLNNLEEGDTIVVFYQNNEHKYKVSEKKIIEPTDTSVLNKGRKEILTLMTCWPIGTKEKRLIVVAKPE